MGNVVPDSLQHPSENRGNRRTEALRTRRLRSLMDALPVLRALLGEAPAAPKRRVPPGLLRTIKEDFPGARGRPSSELGAGSEGPEPAWGPRRLAAVQQPGEAAGRHGAAGLGAGILGRRGVCMQKSDRSKSYGCPWTRKPLGLLMS